MLNKYDVFGIGNAIVDLQINVSDGIIRELGLTKGSMRLVSLEEQNSILGSLSVSDLHCSSGGSAANSMIALSELGSKASYCCLVGNDPKGIGYIREMEKLGIDLATPKVAGATTGTCLILVTPDGERTMNTHLGISSELSSEDINEESLSQSKWLYIEGYPLSTSKGQDAVMYAIDIAKKNGVKIAVSFSDIFIVNCFRNELERIVSDAHLVFANSLEACNFVENDDVYSAFDILSARVPNVAITMGESGALIGSSVVGGARYHVESPKVDVIDTTGAGDMFAGGFLHGLLRGLNYDEAGRLGCLLASQVVSRLGARLPSASYVVHKN